MCFVLLEEINQVSLMWLERDLTSELRDTEFLHDLEYVKLFIKFAACIFEQVIFSATLRTTAEAAFVVQPDKLPPAAIPVCESFSVLDLI